MTSVSGFVTMNPFSLVVVVTEDDDDGDDNDDDDGDEHDDDDNDDGNVGVHASSANLSINQSINLSYDWMRAAKHTKGCDDVTTTNTLYKAYTVLYCTVSETAIIQHSTAKDVCSLHLLKKKTMTMDSGTHNTTHSVGG
jgi:hypothetical protein